MYIPKLPKFPPQLLQDVADYQLITSMVQWILNLVRIIAFTSDHHNWRGGRFDTRFGSHKGCYGSPKPSYVINTRMSISCAGLRHARFSGEKAWGLVAWPHFRSSPWII